MEYFVIPTKPPALATVPMRARVWQMEGIELEETIFRNLGRRRE